MDDTDLQAIACEQSSCHGWLCGNCVAKCRISVGTENIFCATHFQQYIIEGRVFKDKEPKNFLVQLYKCEESEW